MLERVTRWLRSAHAWLGIPAFIFMASAAQAYPQLHVVALAQRADRATVEPNGVFHLTIHVKIAQRRSRLDELILGSFDNCEIISNETVRTALPDGTDFVERLTLQALVPGDATISPAYIDAYDPALGKPLRFSSNALRIHVTGGTTVDAAIGAVTRPLRRLLLALAIGAGFGAAVFVLAVLFVRRKRRPPSLVPLEVAPAIHEPAASPTAPDQRLLSAAQAFKAAPSQAALQALRSILFELAGVAGGVTLGDALHALGSRDAQLRSALLCAESAAFGPAAQRAAAGTAMLTAIQAYCDGRPANRAAWIR